MNYTSGDEPCAMENAFAGIGATRTSIMHGLSAGPGLIASDIRRADDGWGYYHERYWNECVATVNLISNERQPVIPAKAGIQNGRSKTSWIPGQARNDEPKGSKM